MRSVAKLLVAGALTAGALAPGAAWAEKKPKEQHYSLSGPVQAAVAAAQAALKANDLPTAQQKLAEAEGKAANDDDRYVIGSVKYDLGRAQNSPEVQGQAIEMMLASGKVAPEQQASFYGAAGKIAYQNKDFPKAEQRLGQAVQAGSTDTDIYALLAEAKNSQGKSAEALALLQQGIAKQKAAGTKVPSEWYGRAISIGYAAKLGPQLIPLTYEWLADYPTPTNWHDALTIYRQLNQVDTEFNIDIMRLMRAAKALKGQGEYVEYADDTYLRFPGEAQSALAEGVANGLVSLTASREAKEVKEIVDRKVPEDKASLAVSAAKAKGPAGSAKLALNLGDAYYGYGDYATAASFDRLALSKGAGVDPNVANLRLGAALARAGQKADAKTALAAVTGPRAALAKYWMIWIDQQP